MFASRVLQVAGGGAADSECCHSKGGGGRQRHWHEMAGRHGARLVSRGSWARTHRQSLRVHSSCRRALAASASRPGASACRAQQGREVGARNRGAPHLGSHSNAALRRGGCRCPPCLPASQPTLTSRSLRLDTASPRCRARAGRAAGEMWAGRPGWPPPPPWPARGSPAACLRPGTLFSDRTEGAGAVPEASKRSAAEQGLNLTLPTPAGPRSMPRCSPESHAALQSQQPPAGSATAGGTGGPS